MSGEPLLRAENLGRRFGGHVALAEVSLELWPGEVLAVVGESGSGKTTLLACLAGRLRPDAGSVHYRTRTGQWRDVHALSDAERRLLERTDWGFVEQRAEDGLRLSVSAGGNVAERLMAVGERRYAWLRSEAERWLARVELDAARIDEPPAAFSGGMRRRLQIARQLVNRPRLVFMDEPTSGLDVSVQATLLDLLRGLVRGLALAAVVVTHDLGVARLLAQRAMVMKDGRCVESGLTDQVLEDPQHPYSQRLVASVIAP